MCKISKDVREYLKKTENREKMLKKYGPKAFLDPKGLKYPVINYKTGEYDLCLINSALALARLHKNEPIARKAQELRTKVLKDLNEVSTIGSISRVESYTKNDTKNIVEGYSSIAYPTML